MSTHLVATPVVDIVDGQRFTFDGQHWHMCAVNMAEMYTVSCYVSGRKSSNGNCYRVTVTPTTHVYVEPPTQAD